MVHVVDDKGAVAGSLEERIDLVFAKDRSVPLSREKGKVCIGVVDNVMPISHVILFAGKWHHKWGRVCGRLCGRDISDAAVWLRLCERTPQLRDGYTGRRREIVFDQIHLVL